MNKDAPTLDSWKDLAFSSHYLTAIAIKKALESGNYSEAEHGINELINALSRNDKHAVRSHLTRLMAHIIKWKSQPEKRSASWVATIESARNEIRDYQEETPSLTDESIKEMWETCFARAQRAAELDMQKKSAVQSLSWDEVFHDEYNLTGDE